MDTWRAGAGDAAAVVNQEPIVAAAPSSVAQSGEAAAAQAWIDKWRAGADGAGAGAVAAVAQQPLVAAASSAVAESGSAVASLAASLRPPAAKPRTARDEIKLLDEVSQWHWSEGLVGIFFVCLMAESLRFVVEGAATALADRIAAGALVALCFDYAIRTLTSLRACRSAAALGVRVGLQRWLLFGRAAAELGGLALVAFRGAGCIGAALAFAGGAVYAALCGSEATQRGTLRALPPDGRAAAMMRPGVLAITSLLAASATEVLAIAAAGLVAAAVGAACVSRYVFKREL